MKTLTVGDLCDLVSDPRIDRNLEVVLRVCDNEEADTMVGGLVRVSVDPGCTERESLILDGDHHADGETWCNRCRSEVDPEVCDCGEAPDAPVHAHPDGHAFIPAGCRCERRPDRARPRATSSANVDIVALRAARQKWRALRSALDQARAEAGDEHARTRAHDMMFTLAKLGAFIEDAVGQRAWDAARPTGGE